MKYVVVIGLIQFIQHYVFHVKCFFLVKGVGRIESKPIVLSNFETSDAGVLLLFLFLKYWKYLAFEALNLFDRDRDVT
jgi:hypothetical protein